MQTTTLITTPRLTLRQLTRDDWPFIVSLLSDVDFIRYIGDKGVSDESSALEYLEQGPLTSYREHDHGLYAIELNDSKTLVGIAGVLVREIYPQPDLGYALLPEYRGKGLATEACLAVIKDSVERLGISSLAAFVSSDNADSVSVLHRLDFTFEGLKPVFADNPPVMVFVRPAAS